MQLKLFVLLLLFAFGSIAWMRRSAQRGTPEETRRALAERSGWIMANRLSLGLALGGAILALTGLGMWAQAMLSETVEVELASLESGREAPSSFLRIRGHSRGELAFCRDTRGVAACHTPLTSTPDGTTIAVLVSSSTPFAGEASYEGLVVTDDLWGIDEIAGRGFTFGPNAFVLVEGETPEARRPIGLTIFGIGALLSVVGAVLLLRARRAAP